MKNQNSFSKNYKEKSVAELQKISNSSDYQAEARQAAIWEIERRDEEMRVLESEEEDTSEFITFNTNKKDNKLFLLLINKFVTCLK